MKNLGGEKRNSPRGGKRGCLCKDGNYHRKCCNGDLQNQGIGSTYDQTQGSGTTNVPTTHTTTNSGTGGN